MIFLKKQCLKIYIIIKEKDIDIVIYNSIIFKTQKNVKYFLNEKIFNFK